MDEIPGCGAGGWTLVMKVDGKKVGKLLRGLVITGFPMHNGLF